MAAADPIVKEVLRALSLPPMMAAPHPVVVECLAEQVWQESGSLGDPILQKVGVAHAVLARSNLDGRGLCRLLGNRSVFNRGRHRESLVSSSFLEETAWRESVIVSAIALAGLSVAPCDATHFHDASVRTPASWEGLWFQCRIGRMLFFK